MGARIRGRYKSQEGEFLCSGPLAYLLLIVYLMDKVK